MSQFENAIDMHKKHREAFNQFSDTFSEATVKEFERQVTAWQKDQTKPNPYEEPVAGKSLLLYVIGVRHIFRYLGTTLSQVKLELAQEEAADAARGIVHAHDVSVGTFLSTAFDIEEQQ